MLYFNRTGVSEKAEVNTTTSSKEYDICHYKYFLNYSFSSFNKMSSIDRCHDLLMLSMNLSGIAILNILIYIGSIIIVLSLELAKIKL